MMAVDAVQYCWIGFPSDWVYLYGLVNDVALTVWLTAYAFVLTIYVAVPATLISMQDTSSRAQIQRFALLWVIGISVPVLICAVSLIVNVLSGCIPSFLDVIPQASLTVFVTITLGGGLGAAFLLTRLLYVRRLGQSGDYF